MGNLVVKAWLGIEKERIHMGLPYTWAEYDEYLELDWLLLGPSGLF